MKSERLNAYRVMWLFVFFDLPTTTKQEKRTHAQFRKDLQRDGFTMMQYSVYVRHCASREMMDMHVRRVKRLVPGQGQVSIMAITDRQYGDILNLWGKTPTPLPSGIGQLSIF